MTDALARLLKAHFNIEDASPLQHFGPCGFWQDKPCDCPMSEIQKVLAGLEAAPQQQMTHSIERHVEHYDGDGRLVRASCLDCGYVYEDDDQARREKRADSSDDPPQRPIGD